MSRAIRSLKRWPKGCTGAGSGPVASGTHLAFEAWGDASDDDDTGMLALAYLWRRFGPPTVPGAEMLGVWVITTSDPDVYLTIRPSGSAIALDVGYLIRQPLDVEHHAARAEWERKAMHWLAERVAEEHPEWVTKGHAPDGLDELSVEGWQLAADRRMTWGAGSWMERAVAVLGEPPRALMACDWRDGTDPIQHRVNTALLAAMKRLLRPVFLRDIAITILGRADRVHRPSGFAAGCRASHAKWKEERAAKKAAS